MEKRVEKMKNVKKKNEKIKYEKMHSERRHFVLLSAAALCDGEFVTPIRNRGGCGLLTQFLKVLGLLPSTSVCVPSWPSEALGTPFPALLASLHNAAPCYKSSAPHVITHTLRAQMPIIPSVSVGLNIFSSSSTKTLLSLSLWPKTWPSA